MYCTVQHSVSAQVHNTIVLDGKLCEYMTILMAIQIYIRNRFQERSSVHLVE